jgi:hypothetical protein
LSNGDLFLERGNIPGVLAEFFGLQDAAHDFAGTGFGELGDNVNFPWDGELAQFLSDMILQTFDEIGRFLLAGILTGGGVLQYKREHL